MRDVLLFVGGFGNVHRRGVARTRVSCSGSIDVRNPSKGLNVPKEQISAVLGFAAVPAEQYPHRHALARRDDVRTTKAEALTVPSDMTVGDCVEFLQSLRDIETTDRGSFSILERLFVVDCRNDVLLGYVTMLDLLLSKPSSTAQDLARKNELTLRMDEELEDVIPKLRSANVLIAPVIDPKNHLVGVVTASDVIRKLEIEASDDLLRFGGVGGDEETAESYFAAPISKLFMGRVTWLVALLMLQSLSSLVLGRYQALIESHVVLALFLTMLTGTGGNAGNQSSALIIRGLATREIRREDYWRVILKELSVGLGLAVVLAFAAFARVYLTVGSTFMSSVAVSIAVLLTTMFAILGGTLAPMLLERLGVDPCNCASPALATLTDVGGVLILCSVASLLLR